MDPQRASSTNDVLGGSTDCSPPGIDRLPESEEVANTKINTSDLLSTINQSILSNWIKKVVEIVIFGSVILFVWGLFTIPTIIYALPPGVMVSSIILCKLDLAMLL